MAAHKLTLKIILFLGLTDILETFTQSCFKKTALPAGNLAITNPADLSCFMVTMISSPYLWIGLVSVLSLFIIWSTILSKIELSVAVPIASFSYILVPLVSIAFFHERIPVLRWVGIGFIIMGVVCVSLSSKEKGAPAA